jgi:Uma2 family endonuclease
MTVTLADFADPLTAADLDDVSRMVAGTGWHYELDNGRLLLMAPMKAWRADVSFRLCGTLRAHGRVAYQEQGVKISDRKVRYPDVSAFWSKPDGEAERHDPSAFALVVEVVSQDSVEDDRVTKPRIYAAAGIPEYWIVDRSPEDREDAIVEFFKLGPGGGYERTGTSRLSELEAESSASA